MTINEFKDRTGLDIAYDDFQEIHDEYMKFVGDKDEFCKFYVARHSIAKDTKERLTEVADRYALFLGDEVRRLERKIELLYEIYDESPLDDEKAILKKRIDREVDKKIKAEDRYRGAVMMAEYLGF